MKTIKEITKSYMVKVVYWDEVHDAESTMVLDIFAKNLKDLEKQTKKFCGESFKYIEYVEVSLGIPVF